MKQQQARERQHQAHMSNPYHAGFGGGSAIDSGRDPFGPSVKQGSSFNSAYMGPQSHPQMPQNNNSRGFAKQNTGGARSSSKGFNNNGRPPQSQEDALRLLGDMMGKRTGGGLGSAKKKQ